MIFIFISLLLSNIFIFTIAYSLTKRINYPFIYEKNNFAEVALLGVTFVCIIGLILNFFIPLSKFFNTLLIIFFLIIYLAYCLKENKIIQCKYLLFASIISFLIICSNNIYRPDAGLYHLPFISILNENKILIGLSNLHFRFGHISIIQYGSAIFNNHIFGNEGILILPSLLFSYFFILCFGFILRVINLNKKFKKHNSKLFFFINGVFIYFLYKMNNYNNFGNDVPGHIFVFYIIFLFIKNKDKFTKSSFSKIFYFSIFALLVKNTLILVFFLFLFIPIKFLIKQFNIKNILIFTIALLWFLKNILTSGCIVYPIKVTCIDLMWTDFEDVKIASKSSEAWSKAWSDQKDIKIDQKKYNKNFNWLNTWSDKHLIRIIKILIPFILFMILIMLLITKHNKNTYYNTKKKFFDELLFFSILSSLLWFLKFPMYRYGTSYLVILILSVIYLLFYNSVHNFKFKKIRKNILVVYSIFFLVLFLKNSIRIYDNIDKKWVNYPWPKIYSESEQNIIIPNREILSKNGEIIFYKPNQRMCMYSKSPCTHYNKSITVEKKLGFKIYKKI